jgi:uncharacterized lipoprotein YmbA
MKRLRSLAGAALTLGILMSLAGCVTPGPATRAYLLTPTVAAPASGIARPLAPGAKRRTVVIRDLRLPQYLDRPQIVTRDEGNALGIVEHEQWGGPLREDMMRVLATNLGYLLDGDRVVAAPYPASGAPDYRVEVDIRSFERQPGGRVVLAVQWWVTRGADGSLHASAEAVFSGEPLPAGAGYDALVGSMSAVYGDLARAVARSLRADEVRR